MSLFDSILSIQIPHWMLIFLGLSVAFCLTGISIPTIVSISRAKGLCCSPNGRTSHSIATPTFGGIAVFSGVVLSTILVAGTHSILELRYIFAGLLIIFLIGIKDDILIIAPMKKLAGQIFAAAVLAVLADIRITSLFGFFHIGQLPYPVSLLFTVFVYVVIINGFNLIDGIDGLASGIGILTASVFGLWFWSEGDVAYAIFSFSFIGSMSAFFMYNVFGHTNKIFLGDTGSMLTGFVLSILTCHFLQGELVSEYGTFIPEAPAMVISILFIPLFDSLRVFALRVAKGKSPFRADKQHLHHRLLQLGFSHLKSTMILIAANIIFIVGCFLLQGLGSIKLIILMLVTASLAAHVLVHLAQKHTRRQLELDHQLALFLKQLYRPRTKIIRQVEKNPVQSRKIVAFAKN